MVVSSAAGVACRGRRLDGIVSLVASPGKGAFPMTGTTTPLTAQEYLRLPDNGQPTELVRGRVVTRNLPTPRHGQICSKVSRLVGNFADEHRLGHVVTNDSGILTAHDPDTVRGADVAFYSYARVPPGPFPQGYLDVVPELVFEVRSATDLWKKVLVKVGEYLEAGVSIVCVLDEQTRTAQLFYADELPRTLSEADELTFPDVLGDFRVMVGRFFE
jgi:Uma2 family endonuclease